MFYVYILYCFSKICKIALSRYENYVFIIIYDTDYYQYIKRLRNRKCADLEDVDERWFCNTENSFENIFNQFLWLKKLINT